MAHAVFTLIAVSSALVTGVQVEAYSKEGDVGIQSVHAARDAMTARKSMRRETKSHSYILTRREIKSDDALGNELKVKAEVNPTNMNWRSALPEVMAQYKSETKGHVYEFGVYNGASMGFLRGLFPRAFMWGFDSFQGLPSDPLEHHQQKDFQHGHYHASVTPERLTESLGGSSLAGMVVGFYNDTLTHNLATLKGMKPAMYVDIDADLYMSTSQALDWLFASNLIKPGTFIGYDDWWVSPCSRGGEELSPLATGEGKAHKEIAEKYKVRFECVAGPCSSSVKIGADNWGPIFRVVGLGDQEPSHGFAMSSEEIQAWKQISEFCTAVHSEKGNAEHGVDGKLLFQLGS